MSNENFKQVDYDKLRIVQESLKDGIDQINNLPANAMNCYITHYDYAVALMTIKAVVDAVLEGEMKKEKEDAI